MSDRHEERIEHRIEAALNVLREARAPEGMESRVLAVVRTREVVAVSGHIAGSTGGRRGLVWVGVAAALVMSVGLFAVSRREAPAGGGFVANGVANRGTNQGTDANSDVRTTAKGKHAVGPAIALGSAPVKRVLQPRRSVAVTQDVARSDAELPSFPAPPAPLTQEERLLLKVVRSGDRVELAMLDPAMRNQRVEEEKAEVWKFFGEVTDKGGTE